MDSERAVRVTSLKECVLYLSIQNKRKKSAEYKNTRESFIAILVRIERQMATNIYKSQKKVIITLRIWFKLIKTLKKHSIQKVHVKNTQKQVS